MISIESLEDYDKDLKRLSKKYRTLERDMEVIGMVLRTNPDANPTFSFRLDGLGIKTCVIKVKKIASQSFKGKGVQSGFRLVYAYFEQEEKIVYIELYHKNEKAKEDRARIKRNFK